MKRILSLDGGGIRGLFSLQVLKRIEQFLREDRQRPDLVLADEFDMFAGASTGAIIATGLCWGMSVGEVECFYLNHGEEMFSREVWYRRWKAKYRAERVANLFRKVFCELDEARTPALLGTDRLKKLLLVVMRNATTGSPWPVTNNPKARYNNREEVGCNLDVPLWKLLRASTAAPTFYAPEAIRVGDEEFLFVDGAITPYNNPALIAALTATLEPYQVGWPATPEELLVVSVGTGGGPAQLRRRAPSEVNLIDQAAYVPLALIDSSVTQQDLMCRVLGRCRFGEEIDSEVGALRAPSLLEAGEQKFSYVRYDTRLVRLLENEGLPRIDDLGSARRLREVGQAYAATAVAKAHLGLAED